MTGCRVTVDHNMSDETLDALVRQQMEAQPGEDVQFVWHDDESTPCELNFLRRVVERQQKFAGDKRIYNVFQTHGSGLDAQCCQFFQAYGWRVSVILNGPLTAHPDRSVRHSDDVLHAIENLKSCHVEFDLLVTVNRQNCQQPESVYRYLRGLGTPFLQFIPQLEMNGHQPSGENSVSAQAWGAFLCRVFDEWVREDIGRVFVKIFDSTLGVWNGFSSQRCALNAGCGHDKKNTLAPECQACPVVRLCKGDCPRHRDASGKSVLCQGYLAFFNYTEPYMKVMRDLIRHHRSPIELMVMLK
jgi:uncharacterized protein